MRGKTAKRKNPGTKRWPRGEVKVIKQISSAHQLFTLCFWKIVQEIRCTFIWARAWTYFIVVIIIIKHFNARWKHDSDLHTSNFIKCENSLCKRRKYFDILLGKQRLYFTFSPSLCLSNAGANTRGKRCAKSGVCTSRKWFRYLLTKFWVLLLFYLFIFIFSLHFPSHKYGIIIMQNV